MGKREIPTPERIVVSGRLEGAAAGAPLSANLISPDGTRTPAADFQFDASTGVFSFSVEKESIHGSVGASEPEILASMGAGPRATSLSKSGFHQRESGFIRFEILPRDAETRAGTLTPYYQAVAGIPLSATFGSSQRLALSKATAYSAGVVKAKVSDAQGNPAARIRVAAAPLAASGAASTVSPVDFSLDSRFAPAFSTTNDAGEAFVFPVPTDGAAFRFELLAVGSDACTSTSAPTSFTSAIAAEMPLKLVSCDSATGWSLAFGDGVFVVPTGHPRLEAGVGLTNADSVFLRIATASKILRGFNFFIYEGDRAEGQPIKSSSNPAFASEYEVDLPATLSNGSKNGVMTLVAESATGGEGFTRHEIKVLRNVNSPAVAHGKFTVESPVGVADVLSGASDGKFTLKYADCEAGVKIAVLLSRDGVAPVLKPSHFQDCQGSGNTFTFAGLGGVSIGTSAPQDALFYVKDPYGNTSSATATSKRSVFVDFGKPELAPGLLALGSEFGILAATVARQNDGTSIFTGTTLTPENLGQHLVRFGGPFHCDALPASQSDGNEARAKRIAKFFIGSTLPENEMLSRAVACETGDFALRNGDVTFPQDASDPAQIKLTVFDLAGNASNTLTYDIPPCPPPPGNDIGVCWSQ